MKDQILNTEHVEKIVGGATSTYLMSVETPETRNGKLVLNAESLMRVSGQADGHGKWA